MKPNVLLLLGLLLFAGVCCSPGASISETIPPTETPRQTATPGTITISPTVELFKPEPSLTPIVTSVSFDIHMETMESSTPLPASLNITVVYDNVAFDKRMKTAWGFAALVENQGHSLLFDTGGDGPTLIENMRVLGIDPVTVEKVMLSHAHGDHTGGLHALLESGARPVVYVPPTFPASYKNKVGEITEVIEVAPGQMVAEDIYTTGEMGRDIAEQALVIDTANGLVIITGCAHPGVVEIIEQARGLFDEPVHLVLGGFHLGNKSQAEIGAILSDFRRLEVEQVAPSHCTGAQAIEMFAEGYGENFLQSGAGRTISLYEP